MSFFAVINPEAGTNLVCNPSAETTGNYAPIGATVSQSYDQARWGIRSWKVVTGATSQGMFLFCTTATNTTHYASAYVYGTVSGTISFSMTSGTNKNPAAVIGGKTGGWVRYGAVLPPAQTSQSPYLSIFDSANDGTLYIDAAQLEANDHPTTYIDGDMDGLYRWNGLRHGSSSSRDAQERSGGREEDLSDIYGITVDPTFSGVGMPPIRNNIQPMALQPGALLQSQKVLPREIVLSFNVNAQTGSTWQTLHQKRQQLINLVKGDRVRGCQPFTLRYTGTAGQGGAPTRPLYAKFVYSDGLGFGNVRGFLDRPQVRCLATDPAWYEDNQVTQTLTMQQTISNTAYAAARISGQWQALTTGFNDAVTCIQVDKNRGRIWYGGNFSTAGGVACGGLCYWNGTRMIAVGGATPGVTGGSRIMNMALMPNGDNWVVGDFSTAGSARSRGIARWNNASDTFTTFDLTTNTYAFYGVAIDQNTKVYAWGSFRQWDSVTTQSFITSYLPSGVWSNVAGNPYTPAAGNEWPVQGGAIDKNNSLVVGSRSTTGTGYVRMVTSAGAWSNLGAMDSALSQVKNVFIDSDNSYLLGGTYTSIGGISVRNICKYTGATFIQIGPVNSAIAYDITKSADGLFYIGWDNPLLAPFWNGYVYAPADIVTPNQGSSFGKFYNNDLYLGWTAETITTAFIAGINNIAPIQTVGVYPKISIIGPTTAGTTASLFWLENQSSNERLYFNTTVQGGETITLDLAPGKKTVISDWRGAIYGQPLNGSDLASFHLLPTTNTIALFMTGQVTSTSGSAAILQYTPAHSSVDGGA